MKSSLELYAPLDEQVLIGVKSLINLAQSANVGVNKLALQTSIKIPEVIKQCLSRLIQYTKQRYHIWKNLAELSLESTQLMRILGYKLTDLKRRDEAVMALEEVLRLKGEEP